ncbi:MAG: MBL fold metallo-hydrolase [Clostridia bacterium]
MKVKVLGCYSPNYELKPVSMYEIELENKIIYLDVGYKNAKKIDYNNLEKTEIIISHNHIDHSYGLIGFIKILKKKKIKLVNKINVYIPMKSGFLKIYELVKSYDEFFNAIPVNENLIVHIENIEITFCKTVHKGESYAVKFLDLTKNKSFVYTSDLAKVTNELIDFSKDSSSIMIDSGHPLKFQPFKLGKYHGYTRDLLNEIVKAKPGIIYLTHYKTYAKEEMFKRYFPKDANIKFVKLNSQYEVI